MRRRALAFMAIVLLLFSCGCWSNGQQEAVDTSLEIEILPEDLLEIQAQPGEERAEAYSPYAKTPDSMVSDIPEPDGTTSPLPNADSEPTSTPTPRTSYLLTEVGDEKGYVKSSGVNLRGGPGTSYEILDVVRVNTTLIITGKTQEWYRVEIDDMVGFLLKEFVGLGNVPTPTPKPTPKKTTTSDVKQGSTANYSDDDIYLAAKLIYAEGKNQSTESFLAMANVLYNRVKSKKFGGSIETEVYRAGQFTVVKYSSFEGLKPSSSALKAARQVFNEGKRVLPSGVMYFRAARLGKTWASSRKFYKTIGQNNYYY